MSLYANISLKNQNKYASLYRKALLYFIYCLYKIAEIICFLVTLLCSNLMVFLKKNNY